MSGAVGDAGLSAASTLTAALGTARAGDAPTVRVRGAGAAMALPCSAVDAPS